jgi:HTH-type transcriptional regulator/antitoxin MqsA
MDVPGKWNGKRCPACGKGTLHDRSRPEIVEYRGETFRSNQIGAYCDSCDDGIVYDDPAVEQAWAEFRDRIDAEQAAELYAMRNQLGLTQEEASRLTGGGHNAFSRYENQLAQPVIAVLHLFRTLVRHPEVLGELMPEKSGARDLVWRVRRSAPAGAEASIVLHAGPDAPMIGVPLAPLSAEPFAVLREGITIVFEGAEESPESEGAGAHFAVADLRRRRAPTIAKFKSVVAIPKRA